MRGDVANILEMKAFLERLINKSDLGGRVDPDIRDAARVAMGLKPVEPQCPFCGSRLYSLNTNASNRTYVSCLGCHSSGPASGSTEGALGAWAGRK